MVEVNKKALKIIEEQFQENKKKISYHLEEVNNIRQAFNRGIEDQYNLIKSSALNREYGDLSDLALLNHAFSNLQETSSAEISRNLRKLQLNQEENKVLYSKEISKLEES